jgi:hypothetical protein
VYCVLFAVETWVGSVIRGLEKSNRTGPPQSSTNRILGLFNPFFMLNPTRFGFLLSVWVDWAGFSGFVHPYYNLQRSEFPIVLFARDFYSQLLDRN